MNKSIYLYGAGRRGKAALRILEKKCNSDIKVLGVIDQKEDIKNTSYKIFHLYDIDHIEKGASIVICIADGNISMEVFFMLKRKGIKDIWWFRGRQIADIDDFFLDYCINCRDWSQNMIWQMEMHIMDACNLNCRGCTHFSPLFEQETPDFCSRIDDVRKIKEKVSCIARFGIMGGEPFLNPSIGEYAISIREILPNTDIYIVTNGLLLTKQDNEVFKKIKAGNVGITISEYAPTRQVIPAICEILNKHGIAYDIRPWETKDSTNGRNFFNKPLALSDNNPKYRKLCMSNGCVNICDGKIARCPTLMYIDKFNQYFGTNLPNEGIYLIDEMRKGTDLAKKMKEKVPLCEYCIENPIEWGICGRNPVLEDFAVKE